MHDVIADWMLSLDNLNFDIVNVFRLLRLRTVAIRVESVLLSKRNLLMFIIRQFIIFNRDKAKQLIGVKIDPLLAVFY